MYRLSCEGAGSTYLYLSDKVITALVDGELERLNYLWCEPAISISYLKQREDARCDDAKKDIHCCDNY